MKNLIHNAKSLLLVALFAAATALAGCNAADLTGPDADVDPQAQSCGDNCSNGHNL